MRRPQALLERVIEGGFPTNPTFGTFPIRSAQAARGVARTAPKSVTKARRFTRWT